jgi:putative salt-induced outer membrane protein YdiY
LTTTVAATLIALVLAAPALGTASDPGTDLSLAIAEAQVSYLAPPVGVLSTATLQDEEEAPAEGEEAEEEGLPWKLGLDFALNATTGNTEEVTLRFGLNAGYETDKTRLTIDASYFWKATDGSTTDNKFTGGSRHDWLLPDSRWFLFIGGRLDYDDFESWKWRINFQGGPGYRILRKDDHGLNMILDAYGGIGARKEFASANDEWKPEAVLGVDYIYHITERMRLDFEFQYFPVLDLIDDYRLRSTATWRYALTNDQNLSLIIGYLVEYQAIADPGKERTDFRIWIGIQYSFF